jgi:hypothetical protein
MKVIQIDYMDLPTLSYVLYDKKDMETIIASYLSVYGLDIKNAKDITFHIHDCYEIRDVVDDSVLKHIEDAFFSFYSTSIIGISVNELDSEEVLDWYEQYKLNPCVLYFSKNGTYEYRNSYEELMEHLTKDPYKNLPDNN